MEEPLAALVRLVKLADDNAEGLLRRSAFGCSAVYNYNKVGVGRDTQRTDEDS